MALSDATVRQAKATGKDDTLGDIDGLSLGVTASGGTSWHCRYSWAGKQKRMSLGTYPEVGLRQARSLRDDCWPRASTLVSTAATSATRFTWLTRTLFNSCTTCGRTSVLCAQGWAPEHIGADPAHFHQRRVADQTMPGDVVVIRYEGPKGGPGMEEVL